MRMGRAGTAYFSSKNRGSSQPSRKMAQTKAGIASAKPVCDRRGKSPCLASNNSANALHIRGKKIVLFTGLFRSLHHNSATDNRQSAGSAAPDPIQFNFHPPRSNSN